MRASIYLLPLLLVFTTQAFATKPENIPPLQDACYQAGDLQTTTYQGNALKATAICNPAPSVPGHCVSNDELLRRSVRLEVFQGTENITGGSGVLFQGNVLTANHVIDYPGEKITAIFYQDGKLISHPFNTTKQLPSRDLAWGSVDGMSAVTAESFSIRAPIPGESVRIVGFGNGNLTIESGIILADAELPRQFTRMQREGEFLSDIFLYGGSSGSGVWACDGSLVGIVRDILVPKLAMSFPLPYISGPGIVLSIQDIPKPTDIKLSSR